MIKEEVDIVFPMIDVGETGKIDRKALTEWVVHTIFSVIEFLSFSDSHALSLIKCCISIISNLLKQN